MCTPHMTSSTSFPHQKLVVGIPISKELKQEYGEEGCGQYPKSYSFPQRLLTSFTQSIHSYCLFSGRDTISAQAALMYDAVSVLVEAFNRMQRKKPENFKSLLRRGQSFSNGSRALDCNANSGWVIPWEHGEKISNLLRKVRLIGVESVFEK